MALADEVARLEQELRAGKLTPSEFRTAVARAAAGVTAPPKAPPRGDRYTEPDTDITTADDLRLTGEAVPDPFGGVPPRLPLPPTVVVDSIERPSEPSGPGPTTEPVPSRLGAYKLVELVGQGGMGLVYAAKHLVRPGLFAVKVPRPHLAADRDFVRRFRREARVGLKLDHPGIVKVHDLIIDGEYPAMVMDFVSGANLDSLLRNSGGPLAWARTADLFGQVLDAMEYAHAQGCVHRDLKPKNVLVQPDGKAFITDFGLARLSQGDVTQSDMLLGTAAYIAPELYAKGGTADARSDIYALGMTLYKMLAGRLPFEPRTPAYQILRAKEHGDVAPPSTFQPGLPEAVDSLVMRALAPDPEARFQDCAAFRRELRGVMSGLQAEPTLPFAPGPLQAEATVPFTSGPPPVPSPDDDDLPITQDGLPQVYAPTSDETLDPQDPDATPADPDATPSDPLPRRSFVAPTIQAPAVGRQAVQAPRPAVSNRGRRIIGALAGCLLVAILANVYLLMQDDARSGGRQLGAGGDQFGAALAQADRREAAEAGLSEDLPEAERSQPAASSTPEPGIDWGAGPGTAVPEADRSDDVSTGEKAEQVRAAVAREIAAAGARDAVTREMGILHLTSSPPSRVEIDGVAYGTTEVTGGGIPLPEGKHIVRFVCSDPACAELTRRGAKKTVVIEPGRTMRFHADFLKLNGKSPARKRPAAAPTPGAGDKGQGQ